MPIYVPIKIINQFKSNDINSGITVSVNPTLEYVLPDNLKQKVRSIFDHNQITPFARKFFTQLQQLEGKQKARRAEYKKNRGITGLLSFKKRIVHSINSSSSIHYLPIVRVYF